MPKNHEFVALIPARGGSKGVPRKNIKQLGGFPLIAYTIAVCRMSKYISRVIVSTDDVEIAEISKYFGAEVPFIRPARFASDSSPDYEFIAHAMKWFLENEGELPEYLVHMRPTTPFREVGIVDSALEAIRQNKEYSSLRSAHAAPESPYKWFIKGEGQTFRSLADGISNDDANNGRNNFQQVYIPDGYVDVLRSSYVLENQKLHGEKMLAFESPVCVEVDTQEEFELLEYQLNKGDIQLHRYLREHFRKEETSKWNICLEENPKTFL